MEEGEGGIESEGKKAKERKVVVVVDVSSVLQVFKFYHSQFEDSHTLLEFFGFAFTF